MGKPRTRSKKKSDLQCPYCGKFPHRKNCAFFMKMKKKCNNPKPDAMYGKDEFKDLHFYCVHCGAEVISIRKKGGKESEWYHGKIGTIPIFDKEGIA